ncbi:hypothetical protein HU200_027857 [Digitaria exilis]|uniref:Uncharacterized protein n=1 Tax=Digitaria exilis TaxID=1010633 RepID=A0A835ESU9_9POAL|nr:hypothetical protein HU200_066375 [Digitaria exilis]KAF8713879.1 hypothetical protein HU200_027857 [Digitaria exilis]
MKKHFWLLLNYMGLLLRVHGEDSTLLMKVVFQPAVEL